MARVVKVDLLLEASKYIRGARDADRATEQLADSLDDVARTSKDTTDSTDRLGGGLDDLAHHARRLDTDIAKTKVGIRDLAREIAQTSDAAKRAELTKKLGFEQRGLRKQIKLRDLIDVDSAGDMGMDMAQKASLSFAAKFGPLLARAPMAGMNPAALAIGAPIALGVATLVGTAVGGAIIGAVGIGGVVGGLKLASKDPAVKAAGAQLGEDLSAMLGRSSAAFVPVTLGAIDTIRKRSIGMEDDFKRLFTSASRYVDPLVDGLFDAADNAMPGLIDAMDAAGPVIEVIADGMRDLGQAVGDGLSDLAPYADEGARALQILFAVMNGGVRVVFDTLENMARLYSAAEIVGAVLSGDVPKAIGLVAAAQDDAGGSSGDLATELSGVGLAAAIAAGKAVKLVDVLQILNGIQLNANEAERAFQGAVDNARDAFDKKVKSINLGTERGRKYSEALDGIATTARSSAQAIYDQTGSVEKANGKINEGRTALYKQARQYGLSEGAAWAYVNSVLSIPKNWNTDIKASTATATAAVTRFQRKIDGLHGKTVIVTVQERSAGHHVSGPGGSGTLTRRWGGVTEHARDGLLRDASIYAPAGPARYAFAEPATGGEAFIPKYGDMARSRSIWAHVGENWLGMRPAMQPAGGVTVVNRSLNVVVNVPATVNKAEVGREVVEAVKAYERSSGKGWRA